MRQLNFILECRFIQILYSLDRIATAHMNIVAVFQYRIEWVFLLWFIFFILFVCLFEVRSVYSCICGVYENALNVWLNYKFFTEQLIASALILYRWLGLFRSAFGIQFIRQFDGMHTVKSWIYNICILLLLLLRRQSFHQQKLPFFKWNLFNESVCVCETQWDKERDRECVCKIYFTERINEAKANDVLPKTKMRI